jgi:hypothetical protein
MIYPLLFIGLSSINKIQLLIGDHGFYFKKNIGYKSQETLKEFGAYKIPAHIILLKINSISDGLYNYVVVFCVF